MTAVYVLHALLTAFRAARFDVKTALEYDHSFEGFFRSFFAAVLCAPLYILVALGEDRVFLDVDAAARGAGVGEAATGDFASYLMDAVLYLLDWVAFPLVMIGVARMIGAGGRYVPYIVAYNWGTCVVMLATVPPYLAYLMGFATLTGFVIFYYVSVLFVLVYRWRLARDGLKVPPVTAGGIVSLDVLLSAVILLLTVRLQGLFQ